MAFAVNAMAFAMAFGNGQVERRAFAPQSRSQRPEKLLSDLVLTARIAKCPELVSAV